MPKHVGVLPCRCLVILFARVSKPARPAPCGALSRAVSIRRSSGQMPRMASAFVSWLTGGLLGVLACRFFGPFLNGMKRWHNDDRLAGKKRGKKRRVTFCSSQVADAPAKKARGGAAASKRAGEADEREKTKAAKAKAKTKAAAAAVAQKARLEAAAAAEKARAEAAAAKRENEAAEKTKAAEAKKVAAEEATAAKQAQLVPAVSYKDWQNDADAIERMHILFPSWVPAALSTMRRKQQLHTGDRSHRFIRKLDALTPTLTYSGCEEDARELEWPQPNSVHDGGALYVNETMFDSKLECMRRKQQDSVCGPSSTSRSHKNLRDLDKIIAQFESVPGVAYKGWRNDADVIERMHINYPKQVPAALSTMLRKQQLHTGDRSHRYIRKLDALTPTLTYGGWKEDARKLEWPQPVNTFDGGVFLSVDERQFDNELECMRRKQDIVGGRGHENLRNIDEAVARLARGMQIPPSFAPPSNSASSLVLWDAKELPIESLIKCILDGKTCALSCLGMQPGLSHPPEEIRARFKVLALRVHPDKETHPRAEEAFVVVRAAYERLSAA